MFTASEKRKTNIAEYLLYMWQIEDMIRANDLDIDKIRHKVIDRYTTLTLGQRKQLEEWYESLIDMMISEGIRERGHMQINQNVLSSIIDLHHVLLKDPKFGKYTEEFYRILPYIVELRAKSGAEKSGEIETCFNALYGMLLLRISQKEISQSTADAIKQISSFIALLSHYYRNNDEGHLFNQPDATVGE